MTTTSNLTSPHDFRLPVSGMTCASCVSRVEKALKKQPGVRDVSVNLATEEASMRVDQGTDRSALVEAAARPAMRFRPRLWIWQSLV